VKIKGKRRYRDFIKRGEPNLEKLKNCLDKWGHYIGFIFTISPIILYCFVHGNYERYIWIINGPYPFSHFGSGPFHLFMYLSLLIVGAALIVIAMMIKRVKKK